jgi:hypothetical protein
MNFINYKGLLYGELIEIIQDCQKELFARGTLTKCFNVKACNIKIPNPIYITDHNIDDPIEM